MIDVLFLGSLLCLILLLLSLEEKMSKVVREEMSQCLNNFLKASVLDHTCTYIYFVFC
jgi:hypothetical protein